MEKMEQKVNEREARAAALGELSVDSLDKKFRSFEGDTDIEAELAALKGQAPPTRLIVEDKEPVLIEAHDTVDVEAEKVNEADDKS